MVKFYFWWRSSLIALDRRFSSIVAMCWGSSPDVVCGLLIVVSCMSLIEGDPFCSDVCLGSFLWWHGALSVVLRSYLDLPWRLL